MRAFSRQMMSAWFLITLCPQYHYLSWVKSSWPQYRHRTAVRQYGVTKSFVYKVPTLRDQAAQPHTEHGRRVHVTLRADALSAESAVEGPLDDRLCNAGF